MFTTFVLIFQVILFMLIFYIFRPRINKLNSVKDSEQKASGNYFFLEDE